MDPSNLPWQFPPQTDINKDDAAPAFIGLPSMRRWRWWRRWW